MGTAGLPQNGPDRLLERGGLFQGPGPTSRLHLLQTFQHLILLHRSQRPLPLRHVPTGISSHTLDGGDSVDGLRDPYKYQAGGRCARPVWEAIMGAPM